MQRINVILAVVLLLTLMQSVSTSSMPNQTERAVLKGTVFDPFGAVILLPGRSIVIESLGTKQVWELETDDSGSYRASLPAGTYRITSKPTIYLPFRHADFHLEKGSTSMVNLVLHSEYLIRGTTVGEKVDELAPKPQFVSFTIPGARSDVSRALIRHLGKRSRKGKAVYEYSALTFDLITVYADEISRDGKQLRFNASGRVIVEDGKERARRTRGRD